MTDPSYLATTVERMTRQEAEILARYAAGEISRQIATGMHISLAVVGDALDQLAGNDKGRARTLTLAWQERAKAVQASKPAAPAAQPTAQPPSKPTTLVQIAPAPAAPPPIEPERVAVPDGFDADKADIVDLLTVAEHTDSTKLAKAAVRIRDLVDDLRADLADHLHEAQLRAELAAVEARAAAIKQQLRSTRTPSAPAGTPTAAATPARAIRAWAAVNGLDCPAMGRIPEALRARYEREAA